jgi:hypothetical protein
LTKSSCLDGNATDESNVKKIAESGDESNAENNAEDDDAEESAGNDVANEKFEKPRVPVTRVTMKAKATRTTRTNTGTREMRETWSGEQYGVGLSMKVANP